MYVEGHWVDGERWVNTVRQNQLVSYDDCLSEGGVVDTQDTVILIYPGPLPIAELPICRFGCDYFQRDVETAVGRDHGGLDGEGKGYANLPRGVGRDDRGIVRGCVE